MEYQITVKPGSSQEKIIKNGENELTVYLRAKPHDGEANVALIKLLSKFFHTAKSNIVVTRGQKSKKKTVTIF